MESTWNIQNGRIELDNPGTAKSNAKNGEMWILDTSVTSKLQYKSDDAVFTVCNEGGSCDGSSGAYNTIQEEGSSLAQRTKLNFIGSTVTCADNSGTTTTDCTVTSATTSPGGSSPQLQYNNASSFGGVSGSGATATGSIGVGTSAPRTKLEVIGQQNILNSISSGSVINHATGSLVTSVITGATSEITVDGNASIVNAFVDTGPTVSISSGAYGSLTGGHFSGDTIVINNDASGIVYGKFINDSFINNADPASFLFAYSELGGSISNNNSGGITSGYFTGSSGSSGSTNGKANFNIGYYSDTSWPVTGHGNISGGYHGLASDGGFSGNGNIFFWYGNNQSTVSLTGHGNLTGGYYNNTTNASVLGNGNMSGGSHDRSGGYAVSGGGNLLWGFSDNAGELSVDGNGSIALGYANANDVFSSNDGSVAIGYADSVGNTSAIGKSAWALGRSVQSTGEQAMTIGKRITNNQPNSLDIGFSETMSTAVTVHIDMTALTVKTKLIVEQQDTTDIMTAQAGGVTITGGLKVSTLNCNGSNGGALTTDSTGNLKCSDDDVSTPGADSTTASDPLVMNGGDVRVNNSSGSAGLVRINTPTMTSPTVNTSFTFTSMMTGTTGGVVVSASEFVAPTGANPTVSQSGSIATDTTRGQLLFWSNPTVRVVPYEFTKCTSVDDLTSTDDNIFLGTFDDPVTITSIGCRFKGTGTTKATVQLHDGQGNNMTHSSPVCTPKDGIMTSVVVTAGGGLIRGEGLEFDTTNSPSPTTDDYNVCVGYAYTRQ